MDAHPPANDCIAISWARLRAELMFIKTLGFLVADKLAMKENSHAYGNPGHFCQGCKDGGGAAGAT